MNILGIGNAIVDVICKVDDEFLAKNGLAKSNMKLIDEIEFKKLLGNLKIEETVSGGSVANSIVGLSQLGNNVGFIGKINDDDLGQKYGPIIPGHTPKTVKRSKVGPRTKFQKDCDWLNAELRRISATGEASSIDEKDGICQVSKFAVKKIISLSTDPMKLHAIWLAGWIQEASFVGKDQNPEHQYFQQRYRIPNIFTHNDKDELSPQWLVSFLPIQDKNSPQLKLIADYFYKSQNLDNL